MLVFAHMLSFLVVVDAGISRGSHSLMALATYIVGETPFAEFTVVLMLDDVQIAYYDSTTWKVVYRTHSDSKYYDEEQSDGGVVFQYIYNNLKHQAFYLKDHLNHTDHTGVHVQQRLVGCELLNNDKPVLLKSWDAFNQLNTEEFAFNAEKNDIQVKKPWMTWSQQEWHNKKFLHEYIYQPICIKTLRRYLEVEKNSVMRKVKPRVRLMQKKLSDSQGLQISCLATGFYPRHINLTLFRDAEPVDDDQITGGEILPNGDGTYQMRKSLIISKDELREGHQYNCTVKHLNLDNKLNIMFDVSEYDPGSFSVSTVIGVLVFMCVFVLIITALIMWKRRRDTGKGSEKSQSDYSPTPSSSQDE